MNNEKATLIDFIEWLAYKKDILLVEDVDCVPVTPYVHDYYDFTRLAHLIDEYQKDTAL